MRIVNKFCVNIFLTKIITFIELKYVDDTVIYCYHSVLFTDFFHMIAKKYS